MRTFAHGLRALRILSEASPELERNGRHHNQLLRILREMLAQITQTMSSYHYVGRPTQRRPTPQAHWRANGDSTSLSSRRHAQPP